MSALHDPSSSGTPTTPATALARPGRHAVVGAGLGVHAPADAGRTRAAGPRAVAASAGRRPPPSPRSRTGEAVRAWGRLGYPRRALRLHAAATAIVERHGGEVPASYDDLLALPGVGDYTAAAIASFAFGRRHVVLDTNVRRVLARAVARRRVPGRRRSPGPSATWPPRCCPTTSRRRHLGGRGDGARRAGVHGGQPALRRPARSPTGAPGGPPATRRTTDRRGAARPGPAPTGSAAAG